MVRSIASERGIHMPSFCGYMVWSCAVLLPTFALVTVVFFRGWVPARVRFGPMWNSIDTSWMPMARPGGCEQREQDGMAARRGMAS